MAEREVTRGAVRIGMRIRWVCEQTKQTHEGLVVAADPAWSKTAQVIVGPRYQQLDLLAGYRSVTVLAEREDRSFAELLQSCGELAHRGLVGKLLKAARLLDSGEDPLPLMRAAIQEFRLEAEEFGKDG